ncbi:unnamed protein product [Protopolystoma xenopodis]|uniref:non-specific serine/threonine protein kinase n=1 Tax=Protopolystoma xenopodis TaxID=117903 RepID=A0A3S5CMN6_9PLAT|nr:unnamed protein product [Protopolystoma xenopodis]
MGIILYEFLVGCVPFYGGTIEELFAHIITDPIEWPEEEEWRIPEEAIELISQLLERDPLLRLGTPGGAAEVKEATFFTKPPPVDFANLLRQKSMFVPSLEHDEDTSFFDPRTDRYQHDVDDDEDVAWPPLVSQPQSPASCPPSTVLSRSLRASSNSVSFTSQPDRYSGSGPISTSSPSGDNLKTQLEEPRLSDHGLDANSSVGFGSAIGLGNYRPLHRGSTGALSFTSSPSSPSAATVAAAAAAAAASVAAAASSQPGRRRPAASRLGRERRAVTGLVGRTKQMVTVERRLQQQQRRQHQHQQIQRHQQAGEVNGGQLASSASESVDIQRRRRCLSMGDTPFCNRLLRASSIQVSSCCRRTDWQSDASGVSDSEALSERLTANSASIRQLDADGDMSSAPVYSAISSTFGGTNEDCEGMVGPPASMTLVSHSSASCTLPPVRTSAELDPGATLTADSPTARSVARQARQLAQATCLKDLGFNDPSNDQVGFSSQHTASMIDRIEEERSMRLMAKPQTSDVDLDLGVEYTPDIEAFYRKGHLERRSSEDWSSVANDTHELDDNAEDDAIGEEVGEDEEEEVKTQNVFHSFASYSPRFSFVFEQSRLGDSLRKDLACSSLDGLAFQSAEQGHPTLINLVSDPQSIPVQNYTHSHSCVLPEPSSPTQATSADLHLQKSISQTPDKMQIRQLQFQPFVPDKIHQVGLASSFPSRSPVHPPALFTQITPLPLVATSTLDFASPAITSPLLFHSTPSPPSIDSRPYNVQIFSDCQGSLEQPSSVTTGNAVQTNTDLENSMIQLLNKIKPVTLLNDTDTEHLKVYNEQVLLKDNQSHKSLVQEEKVDCPPHSLSSGTRLFRTESSAEWDLLHPTNIPEADSIFPCNQIQEMAPTTKSVCQQSSTTTSVSPEPMESPLPSPPRPMSPINTVYPNLLATEFKDTVTPTRGTSTSTATLDTIVTTTPVVGVNNHMGSVPIIPAACELARADSGSSLELSQHGSLTYQSSYPSSEGEYRRVDFATTMVTVAAGAADATTASTTPMMMTIAPSELESSSPIFSRRLQLPEEIRHEVESAWSLGQPLVSPQPSAYLQQQQQLCQHVHQHRRTPPPSLSSSHQLQLHLHRTLSRQFTPSNSTSASSSPLSASRSVSASASGPASASSSSLSLAGITASGQLGLTDSSLCLTSRILQTQKLLSTQSPPTLTSAQVTISHSPMSLMPTSSNSQIPLHQQNQHYQQSSLAHNQQQGLAAPNVFGGQAKLASGATVPPGAQHLSLAPLAPVVLSSACTLPQLNITSPLAGQTQMTSIDGSFIDSGSGVILRSKTVSSLTSQQEPTKSSLSQPSGPSPLVISKGPRGYGFTIRAIRVFYGNSNAYTLHHLIVDVDPTGPAFRAGLREGDLITRVNGTEIAVNL